MEHGKKISFGFNKSNKKTVIIRNKPVEPKKVELVDCLEEQSIKIKDAVEILDEPLVIPIKDNKKNLLDRVKEANTKQKESIKNNSKEEEDTRPDSELTIEELAARELIKDAKNHLSNKVPNKIFVLPIKEDNLILDGEKESTLDDYENVPVSDYGMAMLRGMGWKEGMGIGKNPTKSAVASEPELRPKGLGLGATKMVKAEISNKIACDKEGNELVLKRGTFGKIIAGSHKGSYCEVQGLDDEAGRVIVRTSIKGEILTLNEFLIVPVTKEEYAKESKILNNAKYEEYKEISDRKIDDYRRAKRDGSDKIISSSKQINESRGSHPEEQSKRPSERNEEYLTPKEENRRHSNKNNTYESKNDKYEKVDKYSKDTYKDKYDHRSRSSHRNRKQDNSDSESGSESKTRRDKERKSHYRGESSRSHEDRYKNKKSSRSKHRSRSSSSDYEEKDATRKSKTKSGHHKHSEKEKSSRKSQR